MVENRDAATRLADGRPAVENLQQYVWASGQSGYRDSDLTLHAGQVRDWYGSEDGMDLTVLGGDAELLDAAAAACHEALAVQHRQLEAMAVAWAGPGADACRAFLRRHGAAAATAATAVRAAADALADAADELWRLVDRKASTVVEIEGRTADSRELWLAAAATVSGGAGDRAGAGDVVEHAVKPFVQTTIRNEWLPAMKATVVEVAETYRDAIAEVRAGAMPVFDVPGALGPAPPGPDVRDDPPRAEAGAGPGYVAAAPVAWSAPAVPPATPALLVPAAAVSPPAVSPSAIAPPAMAPPVMAPDLAAAPAPPAPAAPPGVPGDLGGGMSGLGQQFSDTLRSLLGGGADGFEPPDLEPPDLETPEIDEPEIDEAELDPEIDEGSEPEDESAEDSEDEDSEDEDSDDDESEAEEVVGAETGATEAPVDDCPPPVPEAAPVVPAPESVVPVQPLPPAEPVVAEQSPCEIAQGEVPQVGEPDG